MVGRCIRYFNLHVFKEKRMKMRLEMKIGDDLMRGYFPNTTDNAEGDARCLP